MTIYKKIAMSFYSGILSYFIIAPIFGERGFVNYQKLDNNLTLIKNHIEKLKKNQKELKARYINLQVSKSEILKEGNKLGYYPKNSTVIKTNNNKDQYNQGQILTLQKPLFFCVSLVNFFSNEQQYTPFVKTNILKGYLQYIGIYKSIESYTLVHDFNPKSKLEKNCFLKHIAGNSYIIYKTKNEGILWGDYRYSLLSKGQPTIKIIFKKLFNTLKISIPGAILSYIAAIVLIIIWKIYIKNNLINNLLEYLMLLLHSMPRNLTVFLILSLIYYLNLNPKNLIMGGFAWFFSFFIFNSVIFKQSLDKTLSEFYIKAAKSRGINKLQIILKHALIPSITPLLTNMRPILTTAFFGASMIESIFEIDGIGALYLNALKFNDYAISKDLIFIGVFIMLIPNIITDILIYKINPYRDTLS